VRRGGERWWEDRDWPEKGAERRIARGLAGTNLLVSLWVLAGLGMCAAVLAYTWRMNGPYLNKPEYLGWVQAPAAVAVAAYVLPLAWLLVIVVPRLGRGRLVVAWPQIPQNTGTRCTFHVGTSPGGARIDCVRVFLRCVRSRARPLLPVADWGARLAWVAEARLPLAAYAGPQRHLVAQFDVPADAPPTDLNARDAVRWEVLVLGTVGGADYADAVVVPVYAPAA
jgi:hypothetical protein